MATRPDPRAAAIELLERAVAGAASIVVHDDDPVLDPLAAGVAAIGRIYHRAARPSRPRSRH